jgi:hypothetical protein
VDALLRDGTARLPIGHQVRLVAFGSSADPAAGGRCLTIELGHVVRSLQAYLRGHWDVLRHAGLQGPRLRFPRHARKGLGERLVSTLDRRGAANVVRLRHLGIDTYEEPVIYMS